MSERRTTWTDDEFQDTYGFDLWGEWGESNEIFYDDPNLSDMLEAGRVVSLALYEGECVSTCTEYGHDEATCGYVNESEGYVYLGWARVDIVRRVVMPEGWRTHKHERMM